MLSQGYSFSCAAHAIVPAGHEVSGQKVSFGGVEGQIFASDEEPEKIVVCSPTGACLRTLLRGTIVNRTKYCG